MKKLLSILLAVIICMSCVGCGKSSNEKQVYTAAEKAIEAFDAYYFDMEISSEEAIKKIESQFESPLYTEDSAKDLWEEIERSKEGFQEQHMKQEMKDRNLLAEYMPKELKE